MPRTNRNAAPAPAYPRNLFLLEITREAAERLPNFPLVERSSGYFVSCEPATKLGHGDFVAVTLDLGKWVSGTVATKHPQRTKQVRVLMPSSLKGISELPVDFDRSEVFAVTGYHVRHELAAGKD